MKVFAQLMLLWSLALPVAAFVPPRGNAGRRMPTVGSTADNNQRSTDDNDNDYWNAKCKLLKQFYGMYEYHHVPVNWGDTELRGWVLEQAELVNENNLPKERRELLAAVGIVHSPEVAATDTHPVPPMFVKDPFTEQKLYSACGNNVGRT